MKVPATSATFGRCLLAGLFTGIVASLVIVVFNVVYRGAVDLIAYAVVMPLSIFFAFPFFNLVAGGIYYLFVAHVRRGQAWYSITILVTTVIIALATSLDGGHSSDRDVEKFRGLLLGLEIIEGFMAAFVIPFLANHPRLYLTDKDMRGED